MNVPTHLAERANWIVWRAICRHGKTTKLPFSPLTFHLASTSNPATWGTLHQATTALATDRFAGLGFVFRAGDGLFGIDLDACLFDLYNIAPWALQLLREFPSYAEVSPSGRGVKLFALGDHLTKGRITMMGAAADGGKRPAIEVYGWGRFFAFTGRRLENSPAELTDCTQPLLRLVQSLAPSHPPTQRPHVRAVYGEDASKVRRGRAYLLKVAPRSDSIAGCNNRTFRACCVLLHEILLDFKDALSLLVEWNLRSETPWTDTELYRKLADAQRKGK